MRKTGHGFTLMEMLIVVAIVGLFSLTSKSIFPKIFSDLRTQNTINTFKTLISGVRAHYLIFNTYPRFSENNNNNTDTDENLIPEELSYFFPSNFCEIKEGKNLQMLYVLSVEKPMGKSENAWSIKYLNDDKDQPFAVSATINNKADRELIFSKLSSDTESTPCASIELNGNTIDYLFYDKNVKKTEEL